jgi:hypothetical protein
MALFYANENFPLPVVDELRRLGHDVVTIQEAGKGGQAMPDHAVLAFAAGEDRALLTLNRRHFVRLHGADPRHSGIVACSFDPDFPALAWRIHTAVASQPQLAGQLLRIDRPAS